MQYMSPNPNPIYDEYDPDSARADTSDPEPIAPPLEAPGSADERDPFDLDDSFDLDESERQARGPLDTAAPDSDATSATPGTSQPGSFGQPTPTISALSGIQDLPALRNALEASDGSALAVSRCLQNMAEVSETMSPKELSALHSDPLMERIVDFIDANMHRFTAQPLAKSLWSFAKLRYVPGKVLTKMLGAVEAQLDDFDMYQLKLVWWALGRLSVRPKRRVLELYFGRITGMLVDLDSMGLAHIAWTSARLGVRPSTLLDAVAMESASRLEDFSTQDVAIMCWAFAKLGHRPPQVFLESVDRHMQAHFREYSSQGIALVLFGLAMQGYQSNVLNRFVSYEIETCGLQFSPHDLAVVMAAFAMINYKRAQTIRVVLKQCEDLLPEFETQPQLLCSIMWAVAQLRVSTAKTFCYRVMPLVLERINDLTPRSLMNLVFAIGVLRLELHRKSIDIVGLALGSQMPFTNGKQLGNVCIGIPSVPRWQPHRREALARSAMQQCARLCNARLISTMDVLHVFSSVLKVKRGTPRFIHGACAYLLDCMRARQFTAIDVAQAAHCLGTCYAGFHQNQSEGHAQLIAALVHEIEKASIELLQIGELSPRQLSNVLWMFGRLGRQPEQFVFSQLAAQMITEQTSEFNHIDMANTMYAFVAMNATPGLQALDAIAQHVNTHYPQYGQVEMAQMIYGFSQLRFHPGAVVGRVMVVFHRHPDLFDANSKRLLRIALSALEGSNPSFGMPGARQFASPSEEQRAAVLERARTQNQHDQARVQRGRAGVRSERDDDERGDSPGARRSNAQVQDRQVPSAT